jgi:hypothetical protein
MIIAETMEVPWLIRVITFSKPGGVFAFSIIYNLSVPDSFYNQGLIMQN